VNDLFGEVKPYRRPPQKRRFLMHVFDAGDCHTGAADDLGKPMCRMKCSRCGTETDWLVFDTVTEAKRGIPCERCNS
jgi:DNA-directed RNA polymerase subunit RPC12/RpoP